MQKNTIIHLFESYLLSRNFSKKTLKRYINEIKFFFRWLETDKSITDVRDIQSSHILDFFNYLSCAKKLNGDKRYSTSTRSGIVSSLKSLFNYLLRSEKIIKNPFDRLNLSIKKIRIEKRIVSIEDMNFFLDSIEPEDELSMKEEDMLSIRDRAMFELMYGTGIRVGELSKLAIGDIDLPAGQLLVREGKGRKDRQIPVGHHVMHYLKLYLQEVRPHFLKIVKNMKVRELFFLSCKGTHLGVDAIEKCFQKRLLKSGLNVKFSPHVVRHSFASHLLESGANIKQVKELLGHKRISTTVIYTHLSAKHLKKTMRMYHPCENELYREIENEEEITGILTKKLTNEE